MGFYNFCADEVLRHPAPPGSAYFTKEDHEGDLMTSQSVECVEDFEGGGLGFSETPTKLELIRP